MLDFATSWLSSAFDTNVKRYIKKSRVTRWNAQEYRARRDVGRRRPAMPRRARR